MKKVVMIFLSLSMLLVSCAKQTTITTEPPESNTDIPTEPTTEATEPTSEATEPSIEESTDPVTDPEPDPYADIKANPLSLLDMTFGEFEATYGELEVKEYHDGYTGEAYSPTLDMYLEVNGRFYRSQGIREDEQIFGIFVNNLDNLSITAGMSSDKIDLYGWDLYVGTHTRVVLSGEVWYEPTVNAFEGPIQNCTDDFKFGRCFEAFKEIDGYWYTILFYMPEEYEEYDYSTEDSFRWRDAFAEEVRAKKRNLTVARIFVRKEGSISL